jgi:hypothetical protein
MDLLKNEKVVEKFKSTRWGGKAILKGKFTILKTQYAMLHLGGVVFEGVGAG